MDSSGASTKTSSCQLAESPTDSSVLAWLGANEAVEASDALCRRFLELAKGDDSRCPRLCRGGERRTSRREKRIRLLPLEVLPEPAGTDGGGALDEEDGGGCGSSLLRLSSDEGKPLRRGDFSELNSPLFLLPGDQRFVVPTRAWLARLTLLEAG